LKKAVEEGNFRDDLFYRLNVLPIYLPPLRERKEDIPLLVKFFLERECKVMDIGLKKVSRGVLDIFSEYPWPGNIRELENLVRQLIVTTEDKKVISENDLPDYFFQGKRYALSEDGKESGNLAEKILSQGIIPWDDFLRQYITMVLEECRWNVTRAAKCLRLNRSTLFSKMRKLGIKR
ncbi:MAG TPA: sigma-54-dependent Fis family transcriptional regulator, partial [Deltaproteobacteria bacterium]|nr:sigma-54-dependent Fis family transcriptional regulator [Deltaproteobacteria bacterium]